ncbi:MAG: alternative ribosome rescue aminoacyl-tRNA hydrolase ArfB [Bdellovibrionota bacterium]
MEIIEKEVVFTAVRSRGPGGQNVNKVSSAAVLRWDFLSSLALTEDQKTKVIDKLFNHINKDSLLFLRSDESRDLEQNKSICLEKLHTMLTNAFHVPKKRKPTKPTWSSKLKRKEQKSRHSGIKKLRQKKNFD